MKKCFKCDNDAVNSISFLLSTYGNSHELHIGYCIEHKKDAETDVQNRMDRATIHNMNCSGS